jgi:hypothetical protein
VVCVFIQAETVISIGEDDAPKGLLAKTLLDPSKLAACPSTPVA